MADARPVSLPRMGAARSAPPAVPSPRRVRTVEVDAPPVRAVPARGWRLRAPVLALAASLSLTQAARAQMLPFPVPVGPDVLVVPVLLLLLAMGMKLGQTDEKTLRELERRGDWGAIVALAEQRLARGADEPTWREIRGRALQRSGRCAAALPDLRWVFERRAAAGASAGVDDATFQIGLALGLCELQLWQLVAAEGTMKRLAASAPSRWEPPYNLAIVAAQRGDAAAAEAALARLAAIDAARAAELRRELSTRPAAPREAAAPPAVVALPAVPARMATSQPLHASVQFGGPYLGIGDRRLELPGGGWSLLSSATHAARGSSFRRATPIDEVALVTVSVLSTGADGALAGALAFTSNPQRAHGTAHWDGEDFCALREAVHLDRFGRRFEQPECLYVRLFDPGTARASPRLEPALAAAAQAGLALPQRVYEIHYSLYGQDWMVAATWLLPTSRLAGTPSAVQWARDLAAQMAPLARRPDALPAQVPMLGPGG